MRLPAPVMGAIQEGSYREIHSQLPFAMRIFMYCSRMSAYLLIMIAIPFAYSIPITILYGFFTYSKYDIFTIIGYKLFHRLVTQ